MNIPITFLYCALLLADLVWSLPPNYEDIDESEDQPQDAKGNNISSIAATVFYFSCFKLHLYLWIR